ncbi:MAG: hypothetical protein PF489_04515, partial [Salinivirgaceae bacterium]|nr:hypothetical protein [Salinivirgaceae bacterium]
WIGTDGGGLNFFDPKSGKFQCYRVGQTPAKDLRSNKILHSALAANNKYWLATWGGGLHLFDPISKETKHFGDGTRYENCRIHFIKEVSPGILWLGTNDQGLIAYDIRRDKFSTIVPPNIVSYFWDIEVTAKGEVYAVSFDGLFYFQSTESAYRVVESVNLDFTNIYDIFIDRNQTFWAGNISGLVGTINSYKNKFHTFQPSSPFSELPIYSIVAEESSDQLYFSSRNLFVKYNYITKQYQSTNIQPDTWLMLAEIRGENSLLCASRSSFSIYEKINGRITTLKFDKKSSEYFQKHNALIRTIYSTNSGKFWIGAESTGYQIGVKAQSKLWKIKKVICAGKNSDISECHFPSCFLNHPNGDFWIGTWGGGVNRLRAGEQQFVPMMNDLSNKNSISDNYIQCMTVDHDGDLLIGTRTGLNRFDFRSSTFSSLLISDGLDDDMIFAIAVDAKNRAWVSTRRGISLVYDDFKTIKNYIVNDGFSSNEFLPRSVATDRVGNIYFGLKRGLVWFHPDSIYDDPFIPKPVIVVLK